MKDQEIKEYKCPWCGQEQTKDEMELDEHDEARICFMCGHEIIERSDEE